MPSRLNTTCSALLCYGCLGLMIGCQQQTTLEGTVTFNGEPVEDGAITLQPAGGVGPVEGGMISAGRYFIKSATPGEKVAVITGISQGRVVTSREEAQQILEQAQAEGRRPFESVMLDEIPAAAEGNSQTIQVEPGPQELHFTITTSAADGAG